MPRFSVARVFYLVVLVLSTSPSFVSEGAWATPTPHRLLYSHTEVLTPKGYIRIDELRTGDEVISWDRNQKAQITNRVVAVQLSDNAGYESFLENLRSCRNLLGSGAVSVPTSRLMTISLAFAPHNFIVGGVVVENLPTG